MIAKKRFLSRSVSRKTNSILHKFPNIGSELNCVELQNGCLALAHANLYIPSTLNGMPLNPETENVNADLLSANLNQAADIYIQRVNKCPCGDTAINLYRGSDSSKFQDMHTELQVFLKGSKKKEELRIKRTELFFH